MDVLRRLGVRSVAFGAESASDKVLALMGKTGCSAEINQRALDVIIDSGLSCSVSVVVGFPGETEEDLDKTMEFVKRNRNRVGFAVFPCVAFPGTPIWPVMLDHLGVPEEDREIMRGFDWSSLNLSVKAFNSSRYVMLADYPVEKLAAAVAMSS
jgi:radical SAM superfamily enzyme YgiQ (UPF0313 family)